jgi:phosphatidylinositol alpha-mannosyltransferase
VGAEDARRSTAHGGHAGAGGSSTFRVAMICPYDLSSPGGVQGQAMGLARALVRLGHEVLLVAPGEPDLMGATSDVFAAGRAVGVRANGSVAPICVSPLAAARAMRAAREWRADVVHVHEPLAPTLGYGFVLSRRLPVIATFHRSGVPRGGALIGFVARRACRGVQVRAAVSEVARATAVVLCGPGDFEVLFNGIELERFAPRARAGSSRPAVLFLGRHERRKGLGVLLEALCAGGDEGDDVGDVELWVAGSGPETARLQARYPESDRVHWLGVLSDEEVADRLSRAAVLCAPSLGGESFGMVLLEAMAAHCRVVASDIPGYREAAGGHAVLVQPGDPSALRSALRAELCAPPDRLALEAAALHASRWSTDRLAQRYVDLYRRAQQRWAQEQGSPVTLT